MKVEVSVMVVNGKEVPAVTSPQVAEAFGKEHYNVVRDIRATAAKCSESFNALNFELVDYKDAKGERRPMYVLTKDGMMMLTMGYTTPEAMRIKEAYIMRFNEMDRELAAPKIAGIPIPHFDDPAEVARAWANLYDQKKLAEAQRDEAIRTKAEISSRREATAMNTASCLSKENARLNEAVGNGKHYKQVKAIPWVMDIFCSSRGLWSVLGKHLKKKSEAMGYEWIQIDDSSYGTVNAYHVNVITALHRQLMDDRNMLGKYRKD